MITEKFSEKEKRRLKKLLKQYGAIKACSEKTGIHRSTIARVLKIGEATSEIALRLRDYLQGFSSRLFIEPVDKRNAA